MTEEVQHTELASILEGAQPESTPEPEKTPEPTADEPKGEEPSQEAPASEPEPDKSETPSLEDLRKEVEGLKGALTAERKKRQQAEQITQERPEAPDVFDDQKGFVKHIEDSLANAEFNTRSNLSEFLARREFPDLDQKIERFKELVADDPNLSQRVMNAPSPYHEIADIVAKAERLAKLENVDQAEAELTAKIEAKIRAEYEEKAKKDADLRDKLPPSLAGAASKGSVQGHDYSGPTPLSNILNQ